MSGITVPRPPLTPEELQRLQSLVLDSIPGLVAYVGPDLRYRFANARFAEWVGKPGESFQGKHITDILGQETVDLVRPHIDRALAGERVVYEIAHVYNPADGAKHVRVTYVPDLNERGRVQGLVVLVEDVTAAKQAEHALRESEVRFRRIAETAAEGICATDRNGTSTFINERMAEMLGYRVGDILGTSIFDFVFPEDLSAAMAKFIEVQSGPLAPFDFRIRAAGDSILWASISGSPLLNDDGLFVGILMMLTDITARRSAEEEQKAIERQLTLLIEASGTLLSSPDSAEVLKTILDLARRFIEADAYSVWRREADDSWRIVARAGLSDNYQAVLPAAHAKQLAPRQIVVVEDIEQVPIVRNRIPAYRAEGIRSLITVPLTINGETDGTLVFYYHSQHRFTQLETRVAAALGNLAAAALGTADLYERETRLRHFAQSEETRATFLAEASRLLASSLDYETTLSAVAELSVPSFADWAAVDILDAAGELRRVAVKHADPSKIQLAYEFARQYPPAESTAYREALSSCRSLLIEDLSAVLLAQGARDARQAEYIKRLGLCSVMVVPLVARNRSFGVLSFVSAESGRNYTTADLALAEEIARRAAAAVENARLYTESKAAQQALSRSNAELKRANEDLNQFAYSASHDLREPLRMVSIYSQLLADRYRSRLDNEAHEYIHYVVQGAHRMEQLVSDLLEYTRVIDIAPREAPPLDANCVLEKALSNLAAAIAESGAEVKWEMLPRLRMEEVHLLQLFQNIIGNAMKYRSERPPRIKIEASRHDGLWEICIADNGIGIPARYANQVFGIFKRLHSADKYEGTGIGLAICQKIVERYGGRIWVESEPSKGSTFCFTIAGADEKEDQSGQSSAAG